MLLSHSVPFNLLSGNCNRHLSFSRSVQFNFLSKFAHHPLRTFRSVEITTLCRSQSLSRNCSGQILCSDSVLFDLLSRDLRSVNFFPLSGPQLVNFRSSKIPSLAGSQFVMRSSKMKIAILDDYQEVARPHFAALQEKYPDLEVVEFPDTLASYALASTGEGEKKKLVDRLKPFTVISTMRERTPFPAQLLKELPNLKVLLTTLQRNAAIDVKACAAQGVVVAGTTGAGAASKVPKVKKSTYLNYTTQHTWALLLALVDGVARDDAVVKNGGWQTGFMTGLSGKTLGLVGLGRLGSAVAKIGKIAYGMNIIAWSSSLTQSTADENAKSAGLPTEDESGEKTFRAVSKEDLFKVSDVVSLHYVLSERSRGVVSAKELTLMKPTAFLVNTSRGPLVDEEALLEHLKAGKIRGAALDVFDVEPLPKESEWRTNEWGEGGRSRVVLTPHMGYVEEEAITSWYEETVDNVERYLEGKDLINVYAV